MKKILCVLLILFSLITNAQSGYQHVNYRTTPEDSWEGIDAVFNIKIISELTQGGITYTFIVDNIKINSIKIRKREIPVSEIPYQVLAKLKSSIRVSGIYSDFYRTSTFVKKINIPTTLSWAELAAVSNEEGYKQSVKDKVINLYNVGAFYTQNPTITSLNYFIDDEYRKTIEQEITSTGKTKSSNPINTSSNTASTALLLTTSAGESSGATSELDPPSEYVPASSYYNSPTETEIYVQAAATVLGGILDEVNANYDKKMERWAAESKANTEALRKGTKIKNEKEFREKYLPLMDIAVKGDEKAKMTLYFASKKLDCEVLVPDGDSWYEAALKHNNCDAILARATKSFTYRMEDVPKLEQLASLGCIDAMMHLGDFYDRKNAKIFGSVFTGGENEQKAIEWYTKAAEHGSPNAMYCLGMIYKYGITQSPKTENIYKRMRIKYSIKNDENLAFQWFTKSLIPDYNSSDFEKFGRHYYSCSKFDTGTYLELAKIYNAGEVVAKDKAKAKEFKEKLSK
ncbi:tetratricopeptide repeat protein [Flavobacterium sp. NKUCC04_CG]|uniref:tetratricopeptide repeat protein n=1 Tax=Flavobacterium sp. NKUCC04_CG TaxID=2842121 RepID=UPI001C5B1141|nr:tetratricopeptide repeat protein [Flavobacterium sp. NKUCC04_CG]MBW3518046.1 sel1 repeat family protein [Flavobacterium sp. NKUCC04_CG]